MPFHLPVIVFFCVLILNATKFYVTLYELFSEPKLENLS